MRFGFLRRAAPWLAALSMACSEPVSPPLGDTGMDADSTRRDTSGEDANRPDLAVDPGAPGDVPPDREEDGSPPTDLPSDAPHPGDATDADTTGPRDDGDIPDAEDSSDTSPVDLVPDSIPPCTDDGCPCTRDVDCPYGTFCDDGSCKDWICHPTERLCAGDLLVRCATNGGSVAIEQRCNDDNPCTEGDGCADRACRPTRPVLCDDGNACTDDWCDMLLGCVFVPHDRACDDGNPCTVQDRCIDGQCRGQAALPCDDGNPCTEDLCAPVVGCVHRPIDARCDDQNACTTDDRCVEGRCVGLPVSCDDGDPCTLDACLPGSGGCRHTPIPNCGICTSDAACDDGNACSIDRCNEGVCGHDLAAGCCDADEACDDGNPCTIGRCDGAPFGRCDLFAVATESCCDPLPFSVDFDAGWDGFVAEPADSEVGWRIAPTPDQGGATSLYYGNAAGTGFDDGGWNTGLAIGPPLTLPANVDSTLRFRVWMDVESVPGSDQVEVLAWTQGGTFPVWSRPGGFPMRVWQNVEADVSALAGRTVQWVFSFDSVDGLHNDGRGVFIDDVRVDSPCLPRPCARPMDCASMALQGDCVAARCDFDRILQVDALWVGGQGTNALASPSGIAVTPDGQRAFVSDRTRNRVAVFAPDGTLLTTFGALGSGPGQFNQPRGLALAEDRLLVADTANHRIQAISLSGVPLWSLGSRGTDAGRFEQPKAVAASPDGDTLYVADTGNHRIQVFSRNGVFRFAFGAYGQQAGQFRSPSCVQVTTGADILVCDTQNNRVQVFSPGGRFLRTLPPSEGPGFNQPYGAAVLPDDTRVVVDTYRHGLVWMRPDGTLLARFGAFGAGIGQFAYPLGIARDPARDRLLIADASNARVVVLKRAPLP